MSQQFEFLENGVIRSLAFPNHVLTLVENQQSGVSKASGTFSCVLKPLIFEKDKEKSISLNQKFFVQEISGQSYIVSYKNGAYLSVFSKNYEEWFQDFSFYI